MLAISGQVSCLDGVLCLLISLQADGCVMTEMFDVMAERAVKSRFQLLRLPAGHFVQQELPGEFNTAVIAWALKHQEPR